MSILKDILRRERGEVESVQLQPVEPAVLWSLRPGAIRINGLVSTGSEIEIYEAVWNTGQAKSLPFSGMPFDQIVAVTHGLSERGLVGLMPEHSVGPGWNTWELTERGKKVLQAVYRKDTDFQSAISVSVPKEAAWQTV